VKFLIAKLDYLAPAVQRTDDGIVMQLAVSANDADEASTYASGKVRDALRVVGFSEWQCDLLGVATDLSSG
jgi:hypothetical protein